jgi:hypothetical protein
MPYNDKPVDVIVQLGTQPMDTVGFETAMFLAVHNNFTDRQRIYLSTDAMIADGFAVGSPAYKFAEKAFSGNFRPQQVAIGRMNHLNTKVDFTGKVNTVDVVLNITVARIEKAIRFAIVGGVEATPEDIATGLAALISADDDIKDFVTATAAAGVLTINGLQSFSVGYGAGNYLITNTSDETVALTLDKVNDEDKNWYFLSTESHVDADLVAAAAFAKTHYRMHTYSTSAANNKAQPNVTTSIANQLSALSYDSFGIYDPRAEIDFPEGGMVGCMASNDPSFGDSVHLKTLPGVIAPVLSENERKNIWDRNLNYYRMINKLGSLYEGKVASGQYVDTIRFAHWLKFRLEESVFRYMHTRSNMGLSLKMSDEDLPSLKGVMMNNPISVGIRNGSILTGLDTENNTFYDPVITIPKRAQIPTTDLANRLLADVKIELVYNSSLHFVKIRAAVLLDRPAGSGTNSQNSLTAGA